MRRACLPSRLAAFLCAAGMTLSMASAVLGATFNAGNGPDVPDANPGDGVCLAVVGMFGICTLRAAVDEANALPGHDTILISAGIKTLGGDLVLQDDVTLEGVGPSNTVITTVQDRFVVPLTVQAGVQVVLSDLTIRGATAGGVINLGELEVSRVWFDGNDFGGLVVTGPPAMIAKATVRDSTFSHSSTSPGSGRGLTILANSEVSVTNSTFYGNVATRGGAILVSGPLASLDLRSSTLVDNVDDRSSDGDSSAIHLDADGTLHIDKTLIRGTCSMAGFGGVTSNGGNAEGPGDTCLLGLASDGSNLTSAQLQLGSFGDYGGPVPIVLPGSGSVAVDPGFSPASCPSTDARGRPRSDLSCDIGAAERQPNDPETGPLFEDGFESGDTSEWL